MITIDDIYLKCFNKEEDMNILDDINGNSKSNMIHQIEERLLTSKNTNDLIYDNAYLIKLKENIIGYVYLTGKSKQIVYLEYLILKEYRNKGLGKYVVEKITDYIFENSTDLKEIRLNIDRSNLPSITLATSLGFIDDENYTNDKIDFIKDNPYYINNRRK